MIEITALYAGLLALLFLALSAAVIRQRGASRISLGTGDDPGLIASGRMATSQNTCLWAFC